MKSVKSVSIHTRNVLISLVFSLAVSMVLLSTSSVLATTTTGHLKHQLVDWPTGILLGELNYYTTVESHWSGSRYVIDDAYDSVTSWVAPLCFYKDITHSVTTITGIYNEYARGQVEFNCGWGMPTPWGWVVIQQFHCFGRLWVYASGYWTGTWY